MSSGWTFTFGLMTGLFIATVLLLSTLMHYVSQDMDGFRRWLDRSGS